MPVHRGKPNYAAVNSRYSEAFRESTPLVANKVSTSAPSTKCGHGVFRSLHDPEGFASNCTLCQYGRQTHEE
jgi:hypothetical protein